MRGVRGATTEQQLERERRRLVALTITAVLNAFVLALVSVQFVAPPAFIALICVVPAVFSLEASWASFPLLLRSAVLVTLIALAVFGPDIGVWTAAYVTVGLLAGMARKLRLPAPLRVALVALALVAAIFGSLALLFWLGGVDFLGPLTELARQAGAVVQLASISPVLGIWISALVGVLIVVVVISLLIETLAQRVVRRVDLDPFSRSR